MSDESERKPGFSGLIQIKADSEEEVNRRIEAFIATKRAEVDERNIREFINPFSVEFDGGCARTEAVYLHREGEKSHISLKRVVNVDGPQTTCLNTEDDQNGGSRRRRLPVDRERAEAVDERLASMEAHLNKEAGDRGIFERLKALEKKISYLEGLSPEYFSRTVSSDTNHSIKLNASKDQERSGQSSMQVESLEDVNKKIQLLKQALKQKQGWQADFSS